MSCIEKNKQWTNLLNGDTIFTPFANTSTCPVRVYRNGKLACLDEYTITSTGIEFVEGFNPSNQGETGEYVELIYC